MKQYFQFPAALFLVAAFSAEAGDLPPRSMENILVTAERSAQPGLPAALSHYAVDQTEVDLVGAIHPNEIMQRVPGAWVSRGNGQESLIALRSPVLTGAGGCGSFLMAADGISLRAPGFCNVNQLFDAHTEQADRIEVIQGPATALFGSNAMHGVINVLSQAPDTLRSKSGLDLTVGPHDYYRAGVRVATTVNQQQFGLRATGVTDGGYLDDAGYDQQKLSLLHNYEGDAWSVASVLEGSNLNQETAGFIEGFEVYKDDSLNTTNPNPEAYRDAWSLRAHSRAQRRLTDNSTLQLTPYLRSNGMEFLQHFLPWQATEKNGHRSVGLQALLQFGSGSWRLNSGLDADFTKGWLEEVQAEPFSPNQPQGVHYDYRVDAQTSALFSQAEWQASENWIVSGGLRFEYTSYDYDNRTADGSACAPTASACRFFRPADRRDHFDNWSANIGTSYQYSSNQFVFVRYANGFRAPETTELYRLQAGQQVADLDSEQIRNAEFGLRGEIDATFSYRFAYYHMKKTDVIFQDADRQNVTGASTRHQGVELGLDYSFNEQWYAGANFAFARHRYASNTPLLGVNGNIRSNDIDTAPRHFGSAQLGYNNESLRAELEWVHMGRYYLEPENEHSYSGHELFNLRVSKQFSPAVAATVRITNLLDREYAERADFGFGEYRYFVGESRGVYAEMRYTPGDN